MVWNEKNVNTITVGGDAKTQHHLEDYQVFEGEISWRAHSHGRTSLARRNPHSLVSGVVLSLTPTLTNTAKWHSTRMWPVT
jgi:hypothetical protein